MKKTSAFLLVTFCTAAIIPVQTKWRDLLTATDTYMQQHLWNPSTYNYVRRADQPKAFTSDAWGITIELDARAYMVDAGLMKPEEMKKYFISSSALYEKTKGNLGARILARQENQIYIGGDDDLQWCAALMHCFSATHDSDYFISATWAFKELADRGFWQNGSSKGWAWNSNDRRPNGVSTAYGALAAARLYLATKDPLYKQWASGSLDALNTPQVGFFPRDMMVSAAAAMTLFEATSDASFKDRAIELETKAVSEAEAFLHHEGTGERNPTDIGDLADGLFYFYRITHNAKYKSLAEKFIQFFIGNRKPADIAEHGFYSRQDTKGKPILTGAYLGVSCGVPFFPEVAEMKKLLAIAGKVEKE